MSKLEKRVWSNNNPTDNTMMQVYRACVLSTQLYSSEAWASYAPTSASAGKNVFPTLKYSSGHGYPPSLPCCLSATCGGLAMCEWHLHPRTDDSCIPKDLLYSELASGAKARGRPTLCYKDICKRDMRDGRRPMTSGLISSAFPHHMQLFKHSITPTNWMLSFRYFAITYLGIKFNTFYEWNHTARCAKYLLWVVVHYSSFNLLISYMRENTPNEINTTYDENNMSWMANNNMHKDFTEQFNGTLERR